MDEVGNNKIQRPTWVFLRLKTTYLLSHLVELIQSNLNLINVVLKVKEMPFLDTKTHIAFVGTTNEWCPVSLQLVLTEALEKHADSMQSDGLLWGEFANRGLPPFLIRKTKLRIPKLGKISTNDAEFINYFERLHNCNVIKVADADWE
jgi:hypothetical protein